LTPLSGCTRHLAALFRASLTFISAALAVIHCVRSALSATGVTDIDAEAAELLHELGRATHVGRGRKADLGTIAIETNAFGHFGHVLFV